MIRLPSYIKQGDTAPYLDAICKDKNGTIIDVTGAAVQFHMKLKGADSLTVDAAGSVVDGSAGHIRYALQSGDTDTAGTYHCEYEVTYSDGRIETFPNDDKPLVLIVSEQLG